MNFEYTVPCESDIGFNTTYDVLLTYCPVISLSIVNVYGLIYSLLF